MKENTMKNSKRVSIKDVMEEIEYWKVKTQEVEILKKRIADLEKEVSALKTKNGYQSAENSSKQIFQCRKCDETFFSVNDFKKHDKISILWLKLSAIRVKVCFIKIVILRAILKQSTKLKNIHVRNAIKLLL